jgi:thiol-disulfide isomerase/thioredoxin
MYTPTPTFPSGVNTPTPAPGNQTSTFTPTPSITPTPTPSTPTATPTLDPELHDTDPKTVVLASGKVQMVEFFTFWCLPCRAMGPVMNRLEGQYGNRMYFIFLDTDNPETMDLQHALEYRIPTYGMEPQFYLLDKQGKILKHWIGPVSEQELRGTIETALNP